MNPLESKYTGAERRKYPRLNAFITYSIIEEENRGKTTNTKNIGAGGIAFFAKEKLAVDTILSLAITLPDASNFQTKGKVVWGDDIHVPGDPNICCELGIEFIEINDADRQKISEYVFLRLDKDQP